MTATASGRHCPDLRHSQRGSPPGRRRRALHHEQLTQSNQSAALNSLTNPAYVQLFFIDFKFQGRMWFEHVHVRSSRPRTRGRGGDMSGISAPQRAGDDESRGDRTGREA